MKKSLRIFVLGLLLIFSLVISPMISPVFAEDLSEDEELNLDEDLSNEPDTDNQLFMELDQPANPVNDEKQEDPVNGANEEALEAEQLVDQVQPDDQQIIVQDNDLSEADPQTYQVYISKKILGGGGGTCPELNLSWKRS